MSAYLIISTQIRSENGPTLCGDEKQDPVLMQRIGAVLKAGFFKVIYCCLLLSHFFRAVKS